MDDLISIIVPAYNAGAYLGRCLKSILAQTYINLELIIVNDGSYDTTQEVANDFVKQNPNRVFYLHQNHQGVSVARLKGISFSKGQWIGFVDADDEIEKDMYERLIINAKKSNADISHCGYQTVTEGGNRIHYFYNTNRKTKQNNTEALEDLLAGVFEPSLCNKIYRKDLFIPIIEQSYFDIAIQYNEDLLMNFYLFSQSKISYYDDFCGYHYIVNRLSKSRSGFCLEKVLDPVKVSKTILTEASSFHKQTALHNYLSCCLNAYISLFDKPEYKEQADELRKTLSDNLKYRGILRRNERIKLIGILKFPLFFNKLYACYERHFQKRIYE